MPHPILDLGLKNEALMAPALFLPQKVLEGRGILPQTHHCPPLVALYLFSPFLLLSKSI